jgi:drug/metabolite transporter (DMT)-like permease
MPSPRSRPRTAPLVWAAIVVLYLVWGSTYLGIRIAVESIPPFLMAGARFLLAGAIMLVFVGVTRRAATRLPTIREWRDSAIVGGLLMGGGMGLVAWGEQTVPSGIAALMIAMMPVWVAIFGRLFLGERLPVVAAAGIGLGILGVAILVGPSVAVDRSLDPAGVVALLISPIAWSAGSLFSAHRATLPPDPLVATSAQMLTGGLLLIGMSLAVGEPGGFRVEQVTVDSAAAFAYLTVIGSLVAFTAYAWLLRHAPLPLIATYAFVNPVVAVFLGAVVLGEAITPIQLVAGGVIVAGVAVIITARGRLAAAGRRPTAAAAPAAVRPSP